MDALLVLRGAGLDGDEKDFRIGLSKKSQSRRTTIGRDRYFISVMIVSILSAFISHYLCIVCCFTEEE